MGRQKKLSDDELRHARFAEIAAMLGVHHSSMVNWSKSGAFPKKNKDGEFCIRAVMQWFFCNKADESIQRVMVEQMARKLGLRLSDSTGTPIGESADNSSDVGSVAGGFKNPMDLLEYKMKLAKFERDLSDVVRIRHVAPVLAKCFKKIRELLESISRRTGIPVGESMERISAETMSDLNGLVDGGGNDHSE